MCAYGEQAMTSMRQVRVPVAHATDCGEVYDTPVYPLPYTTGERNTND